MKRIMADKTKLWMCAEDDDNNVDVDVDDDDVRDDGARWKFNIPIFLYYFSDNN